MPPTTITLNVPSSIVDPSEGTVSVNCLHDGEGNPEPTITITKDGVAVASPTYTFQPSTTDDRSIFRCVVANIVGSLDDEHILSVEGKTTSTLSLRKKKAWINLKYMPFCYTTNISHLLSVKFKLTN